VQRQRERNGELIAMVRVGATRLEFLIRTQRLDEADAGRDRRSDRPLLADAGRRSL